jgi:predicted metal-dependent peptidase
MNSYQKIQTAKAKLLVDYPYFGTIASKLELKEDNNIQNFKSDGYFYHYNSDFINNLNNKELEFTLSNAVMHKVLAHQNRKSGRLSWLWQLATDYAINDMLFENGMQISEYAHYDKRFKSLYAEEIYTTLLDEIDNKGKNSARDDQAEVEEKEKNEKTQFDDIKNDSLKKQNKKNTIEDKIEDEKEWENLAKATHQKMKVYDDIPLGLNRIIDISQQSTIDWRESLQDKIQGYFLNDYKMFPPNKKMLHLGLYMPSAVGEHLELCIGIDTSGSINKELLGMFFKELESIMDIFESYQIDLIMADAKVQSHDIYHKGDLFNGIIKGGGGTSFNVVFDYIEQNIAQTSLLLYFTDGAALFPPEPFFDIIWVLEKDINIPYGEKIILC